MSHSLERDVYGHSASLGGWLKGALENTSGGDLVAKSCLTLMTPWTVARPAPLSMRMLQVRILEWVAVSFSRGSS